MFNYIKKIINIYLCKEPNIRKMKKMGMKVGKNLNLQRGCLIDLPHCYLIEIGDNVTLAPRVTILAHDASTKRALDYTKIGKVIIGDNVFIGANSTILPNVEIKSNTIVGCNSVVTKNLDSGVYAGSPAKYICSYEDYIEKNKNNMTNDNMFDETYKYNVISQEKIKEMREKVDKTIGYIK